jgi:hypothetical protein
MRPKSISTVSYEPSQVPADISDIDVLRRYLREEFDRIAATVRLLAAGHLDPTYVAPTKPRRGDIRYASGAPNWNPGSGEGIYFYNSAGIWKFLG